ncbi:UPF0158 family protein [Kiloniella sp.]|uniref:UPF0158 family protein n=1 Tax=Kiloniella sp. TaxID=1938587 RepID=UPI003B02E13F
MVLFKVQASLVLSFEPLVNISHGRDNKKQERLSSPCLHTGSSRWIKQVLADDEFIALPDSFEIHEYQIMEHFCYTIEDERVRNTLLLAINGKGAFRRFKDRVFEEAVDANWRRFRDSALKQIAVGFLENQGIAYTDYK